MPLAGYPGVFLPGPGPLVLFHEQQARATYPAGADLAALELCDNSVVSYSPGIVYPVGQDRARLELGDRSVVSYLAFGSILRSSTSWRQAQRRPVNAWHQPNEPPQLVDAS